MGVGVKEAKTSIQNEVDIIRCILDGKDVDNYGNHSSLTHFPLFVLVSIGQVCPQA